MLVVKYELSTVYAGSTGLPKLGKDLVESTFFAGLTDDQFLEFVKTGRLIWDTLNTTDINMPPKNGNPAFTNVMAADSDVQRAVEIVQLNMKGCFA
jgi:hypothetical protein